jgi:ribosome-associated translation inhibitor RaiA
MQLEIIARHFTLGDEHKEAIEAAAEKLERFSPRPVQSFKLTITHDAGLFHADGVLHLKNHDFRAGAEGREPEHAVAELTENLQRQLSKFKGKTSGKQKGATGGLGKALGEVVPPMAEDADGVSESFVLRDMDVDAAREAFAAEQQPFFVFRNVANSRVGIIYRRENGELGHMESQGD